MTDEWDQATWDQFEIDRGKEYMMRRSITVTPEVTHAKQQQLEGIKRSAVHAGEEWRTHALEIAISYCAKHEYVFVDELWEWGLQTGESDRALGSVIQLAARKKFIEKIYAPDVHPDAIVSRPSIRSNLSPKPVWRSLLYTA